MMSYRKRIKIRCEGGKKQLCTIHHIDDTQTYTHTQTNKETILNLGHVLQFLNKQNSC